MLNRWREKIFGEKRNKLAQPKSFDLPAKNAADHNNKQKPKVMEDIMGTDKEKKRILIVDDEEDMIWSLQNNLNYKALNAAIITASSGEEALEILEKESIDLIISDIKMPGISGIDLLIKVRKEYPETGVIIMTAFPSPEFKNEAILKGGLHFIEKPFDINDMRKIVRHALKEDNLFKGTVAGVELSDLVQVNCFSGATSTLRVKAGAEEEGVIFFEEGKVVHAVSGEIEGSEAFYKIFAFGGGMIESTKGGESPAHTINCTFEALLIEGTRRIDEANNNCKLTEDEIDDFVIDFDPKNTGEAASPRKKDEIYATEPAHGSEAVTLTEEGKMKSLQDVLNEFTNIQGVNTACLVGRDGFLLESIAHAEVDTEMIGAIASSGFGASESMGNQLGKGAMSMTMIEYNNGPVMLSPVGDEAFLVIVADRDSNLGMIRLKIKKHARDIELTAAI